MKYELGDEYRDDPSDFITYGITCGDHVNQIEVHGDEKLRDMILDLLIASQPTIEVGRADADECPECETWWALGEDCQLCNRKPPAP